MTVLEPDFENLKEDDGFVTWGIALPDHCPSTLILLSQNMVEGMYLAGGSCITIVDQMHQFSDFDVYVTNDEAQKHVESLMEVWGYKKRAQPKMVVSQPKQYYSSSSDGDVKPDLLSEYSDDLCTVQLIRADKVRNLEHLLSSFDLEVCKIGVDTKCIMVGKNTINDIQHKQIECNPVNKHPARLFMRLIKYAAKGYRVAPGLVEDIWTKNQKPPVLMKDTDWAKLVEEAIKTNKANPYPPMIGDSAKPYDNPYTISWTRNTNPSTAVFESCGSCGRVVDITTHVCSQRFYNDMKIDNGT